MSMDPSRPAATRAAAHDAGSAAACAAVDAVATATVAANAQSNPSSEAPAAHARDFLRAGNPRPVLEAARTLAQAGRGILALVLEAEGSTYAAAGTVAVFDGEDAAPTGWLSGGCLEPELARRAAQADAAGQLDWIEIDTREDADLFSGAALGCRGRLRIALLPLRLMPGLADALVAWLDGGVALQRVIGTDGKVSMHADDATPRVWSLPATPLPWQDAARAWHLPLPRLPEVLLLGAGPETPMLLRLLRELGWRSRAGDPRPRWQAACAPADYAGAFDPAGCDAALVMHHGFEADREALERLAGSDVSFVGLLGPRRRRDDLLALLRPAQRDALRPRLHAPVGLDLGGQGPEAIALSIAAQLQAWRAGRPLHTVLPA